MKLEMSLSENKTSELFKSFMPRRKEIKNHLNQFIVDLRVYPNTYFKEFNPSTLFIKWALVEVSETSLIPKEMETFQLISGQYACFKHTGSYMDNSPFDYIFGTWLPQSEYEIDNRPHFDIMNRNKEQSEQEIWIPIK